MPADAQELSVSAGAPGARHHHPAVDSCFHSQLPAAVEAVETDPLVLGGERARDPMLLNRLVQEVRGWALEGRMGCIAVRRWIGRGDWVLDPGVGMEPDLERVERRGILGAEVEVECIQAEVHQERDHRMKGIH